MDSTHTTPKRSWLKIFFGLCLILALIGGGIAYYLYNQVFGINLDLKEDTVLTIPTGSSLEDLAALMEKENIIKRSGDFLFTAQQMSFNLKTGKYLIPKSIKDNYNLVRILRGSQLSVKLTFHNFRVVEQLAAYVGSKIEADSAEIIALLEDAEFLKPFGFTPENVMAAFIPNTYELYWNCDAQEFWKRMQKEYKKFWSADRLAKAKALELSPIEVYTLASIVESESQHKPERPRIAGVYLNRLQTLGWKLEADPTVVFALGDFSITRVLERHLKFDSPYNTYKYAGLPPGPIYMSSINAIDAVLNAEDHDYWFFCAKVPEEGESLLAHAFAKTHSAHIRNAKKYWAWLNKNR